MSWQYSNYAESEVCMQRDKNTRLGCDMCKENKPTYGYESVVREAPKLWLCETCVKQLTDWPSNAESEVGDD